VVRTWNLDTKPGKLNLGHSIARPGLRIVAQVGDSFRQEHPLLILLLLHIEFFPPIAFSQLARSPMHPLVVYEPRSQSSARRLIEQDIDVSNQH